MIKKIKVLDLGREKVDVYYENFEYFQPNKRECGDCSIRSICAAEGMDWFDVFDGLSKSARANQWMMGIRENITDFVATLGYEWHPITPKRGERRPTVAAFAKSHPDDVYIMLIAGHAVGGKYGKYMDIWDCGYKSLYGYWLKKK